MKNLALFVLMAGFTAWIAYLTYSHIRRRRVLDGTIAHTILKLESELEVIAGQQQVLTVQLAANHGDILAAIGELRKT